MSLFSDPLSSSTDFIHAHCDGGSRGNPGPSGYGAVVTDATGHKLAELSEFLGIRTNNFAEYSGLLAVLDWTLKNRYTHLKVVSDSELMVKQIQGKYRVNSPDLRPLWQQARQLIARLDAFEITHALRHKNKDADALANQAMDRGTHKNADAPSQPTSSYEVKTRSSARRPAPIEPAEPKAHPAAPAMLHGFTKNGVIQLLGGATLPDGIFVKIIRE
jgi:ribonuclease HI